MTARNRAELDAYAKKAPAFMSGHAFKRLAYFTDACDVVEGPPVESVAILEFASMMIIVDGSSS